MERENTWRKRRTRMTLPTGTVRGIIVGGVRRKKEGESEEDDEERRRRGE